jgi:hypothetical protein
MDKVVGTTQQRVVNYCGPHISLASIVFSDRLFFISSEYISAYYISSVLLPSSSLKNNN